MYAAEILLGSLLAVPMLAMLARKLGVPYPVLLLLGGLGVGFIPGLPKIELAPDLIFLLFLPPLVYHGAVLSALRDLRANRWPITVQAIGLVLTTTTVVASVVHAVGIMPWAAAFVLGAVVSTIDAGTTNGILGRLRVPRRIVRSLEGEGLLTNPASLIAYQMAVGAVVTGTFSLSHAALQFVVTSIGGAAIGWGVGWLSVWGRRHLEDSPAELTVSLLTPYAAYQLAERLGLSGVIAVVAAGLYVAWTSPTAFPAETRRQRRVVWETLVFLLTGILFILLGFQSRKILNEVAGYAPAILLRMAVLTCATVVLLRIGWVFVWTYLPRALSSRFRRRHPSPPWQETFLIAWANLRGVATLATALALPLVTAHQMPFPDRSLITFLGSCLILVTSVLPGLSLPSLIRWLHVVDDNAAEQGERMGKMIHLELLDAERHALIEMRDRGEISDDVLRRVERELDFEELRVEG